MKRANRTAAPPIATLALPQAHASISLIKYTTRSASRAAYRLTQITNPMSTPLQNPVIRVIKSPE